MDACEDTNELSHIHLWPYWSLSSNTLGVSAFFGIGILSLRNDNPLMSDIYIGCGYAQGIQFGTGSVPGASGVTHKFHLSNVDIDGNHIGIAIVGMGTTGQMSNVTIQGYQAPGANPSGNCGIYINATVQVFASNLMLTAFGNGCIYLDSASGPTQLTLMGLWCQLWNYNNNNSAAIQISGYDTISEVTVGPGAIFQDGPFGGPLYAPPGQVTLTSTYTA